MAFGGSRPRRSPYWNPPLLDPVEYELAKELEVFIQVVPPPLRLVTLPQALNWFPL